MRIFSRRSPPESSLKVKPEGILQYSIKWFRHTVKERKKKNQVFSLALGLLKVVSTQLVSTLPAEASANE